MSKFQQILSQLRGRLGRRRDRRELLPDRHFATRLDAGGAARLLPGQGGHIGPEPRLSIPFELKPDDAEVKVVVFSDPPGLLSLEIELPDGTPLASAPGARRFGLEVDRAYGCSCSFELPAGWPRPHGIWRVVLKVDTESFKQYLMGVRGSYPREFERLAASGVYYSVSALAARRPAPAFSWKLVSPRAWSPQAWLPAAAWRERPPRRAAGRRELVLPLP